MIDNRAFDICKSVFNIKCDRDKINKFTKEHEKEIRKFQTDLIDLISVNSENKVERSE